MKELLGRLFGTESDVSKEAREALVTLIRAAQQDETFREQLVNLLSLDQLNRRSALNTFLDHLQLKQAPRLLESAVAMLLDDSVAQKTLEILTENRSSDAK